ncbi:MAG TPA: hypothetical protein P5052_03240 [Candidatus Paceibacterota bacterium]|nr:hypothetical protein [Candidatus Paceibacterota bacterium]
MTNFISSSGEVRVRSYYATGTTSGYYFLDYVNLELAIDPVYEPANFERIDGGTTTNYVSDIIGARAGIVTASDNTRQGFQNLANTSIDINYTFNGVRKYTGMNTLLINLEGYVSNAALTIGVYL